jgi:hypothetical protein
MPVSQRSGKQNEILASIPDGENIGLFSQPVSLQCPEGYIADTCFVFKN